MYFRGIERLFIAFSGLICILLGFALFRQAYGGSVGEHAEFSAKGGGFEIGLKNSWPGVFFAAFGMIILVASVITRVATEMSKADGSGTNFQYQAGGIPTADTKSRAMNAVIAMGEILALEGKKPQDAQVQKTAKLQQLATAQIDLVDIAFGEGSYAKYLDLEARTAGGKNFNGLSPEDRRFLDELRSTLAR